MSEYLLAYHDPMLRIVRIREYARDGSDRTRAAWEHVTQQPSWIIRVALAVFFVILAIPIVLLLLIAFLAALVIFSMLAIVNACLNAVRGLGPRRDGRDNVRVIRRPE